MVPDKEQPSDRPMQITYFPYLCLGTVDEFPFGDVKVWNFRRKCKHYITQNKLRDKIRRLVRTNKCRNKTIEDVGVVSLSAEQPQKFDELTAEEISAVREIQLLLFLSFVSKNNTVERGPNAGSGMATSENFELVFQKFRPREETISFDEGFVVRVSSGGHKIDKAEAHCPRHLLQPIKFSVDNLLLSELYDLKCNQENLFGRILRATDLLFQSYYNDINVSQNARILLQASCFEVLLQLPDRNQRKVFTERIAEHTGLCSEKERKFLFESAPGKKKKGSGTLKVIWADKFFTLRNHIIHGERVKREEFWFRKSQRHFDIAVLFFILLVKKLINERRGEEVFTDEISWGKTENPDGRDYVGFKYDERLLARIAKSVRKKFTTTKKTGKTRKNA